MAFGVFPIVGTSGLMSIDLGLRGAVVALCLLIASMALRDRRDSTAALLGAGGGLFLWGQMSKDEHKR